MLEYSSQCWDHQLIRVLKQQKPQEKKYYKPVINTKSMKVIDLSKLPDWLLSNSDDEDFHGFPISMIEREEPSFESLDCKLSNKFFELFGDDNNEEYEDFEGFDIEDV